MAVVDAAGLPVDGHFNLLAGRQGGHGGDNSVHSSKPELFVREI